MSEQGVGDKFGGKDPMAPIGPQAGDESWKASVVAGIQGLRPETRPAQAIAPTSETAEPAPPVETAKLADERYTTPFGFAAGGKTPSQPVNYYGEAKDLSEATALSVDQPYSAAVEEAARLDAQGLGGPEDPATKHHREDVARMEEEGIIPRQ